MSQNGATTANGNPGPGGFGGVGGEGLGEKADAGLLAVLGSTPKADPSLLFLYPYDKTVFPLGILAPLLQWNRVPAGRGDGVRIVLSSTPFSVHRRLRAARGARHGSALAAPPDPAGRLESGDALGGGRHAHGQGDHRCRRRRLRPLQQSYTIARAGLRGTVYYQSYGTQLAKNYGGAKGGDGRFGGATLAIRGGSTDPVLVAGASGSSDACRVCHTVSANGTRMIVQHGDAYTVSSSYDLLVATAETPYPAATAGRLGWIGLTPDGALGLGAAAPLPGGANTANTALYDMASGAAVTATGLQDLS